jgi:hypothetical protein
LVVNRSLARDGRLVPGKSHCWPGSSGRNRPGSIRASANAFASATTGSLGASSVSGKAPMNAKSLPGPAVQHDPHRLGGIDVLVPHEPAWLVGSDRQHGDIDHRKPMGHLEENPTVTIAGVPRDIDDVRSHIRTKAPFAGRLCRAPTSGGLGAARP